MANASAAKPKTVTTGTLQPGTYSVYIIDNESAADRAGFHVAMGRPKEARALVEEARTADAQVTGSYEVEGLLLAEDDKTDETRRAFAKAVELGSTNFYAHYRLAMLTWRPDPDPETLTAVEKMLERSVMLNDQFAPAYSFLGEVKGQLDRGEEALSLARRATTLEPAQSSHRLTVARVLWRLSRRDEALVEARRGLALARNDEERQEAQKLTAFLTAQGV